MIVIAGKEVFQEIEEVIDPKHTAILCIDMQKDFCRDDGKAVAAGFKIDMIKAAIAPIKRLLAAAREAGVQVMYTEHKYLPNWRSVSPAYVRFLSKRFGWPPDKHWLVDGTPGVETVEELAPQAGDLVVEKWRSSSFSDTNLDLLLRSNGIKTVVIVGCVTQGCVESTARDTYFHDYYPVLVEDCVASDNPELHEASLKTMRSRVDLLSSDQLMRIWSTMRSETRSSTTAA